MLHFIPIVLMLKLEHAGMKLVKLSWKILTKFLLSWKKTVGNVFDIKHQIDNEIDYRKVLGQITFQDIKLLIIATKDYLTCWLKGVYALIIP